MNIIKPSLLLACSAVAAIMLSGCSQSMSALETRSPPQPLAPAPLDSVQSSELQPIDPNAPQQPIDPNAPLAPIDPNAPVQPVDPNNPQIAALDNNSSTQPQPLPHGNATVGQPQAASNPISREQMAGTWVVASDNPDCRIILAFTKWSGGYRAATRRCSSGELGSVTAWDVKNDSVVLVDSNGTTIASLYSSGEERYDGSTAGGNRISFTR